MITNKQTALKRAQSGQLGRFSEELWKDEDIHAAIVKNAEWFPHSAISFLVRYLPEDMYECYMEDVFHPLIEKQPYLAGHIPLHKRDAYICKRVVTHNGDLLSMVPEELRTEEIYRLAIDNTIRGEVVKYLPQKYLTEETYIKIIRKTNGRAVQYIKRLDMSDAVCDAAIKSCGTNLQYVPREKRTIARCLLAVFETEEAFRYVPQKYKSKTYSGKFAKANPYAVREMRNGCISIEAYREAVKADHSLVRMVPEKVLAKAFLVWSTRRISRLAETEEICGVRRRL